ncbi:MAG: hypothetical protein ACQGVK_02790 [Myxococcota bacterium]
MSHRSIFRDSGSLPFIHLVRALAVALLVTAIAAGCRPNASSRGQYVPGSSCDGRMDYADEILLSNFRVASETPLGDDRVEVAIEFDLENLATGRFSSASAFSDASGLGHEVAYSDLLAQPVDLGVIEPHQLATAPNPWVLQLDAGDVAPLLADLNAGAIPLAVHGAEQTYLEPGVSLVYWESAEDLYWAIAEDLGMNPPLASPPYADAQEFSFNLVAYGDGQESVLDDFDGGDRFYIRADPDHYQPVNLPEALHNVRVVDVIKSDESGDDDGVTTWGVTVARTVQDPLLDLVENGSFCTGEEAHIDWPVQASRLHEIDGVVQEDGARESYAQPIRFNGLTVGGGALTLSGQLQGHVLKPSLQLRLREGTLMASVAIENDLTLTARLKAEVDYSLPETWPLYDLCFPLPDLVAGPVAIPMHLQLGHMLKFEGNVSAGAVVGFQKSVENGYTLGFDGRETGSDRFFAEPHATPHPVQFTPPGLLDDTAADARVATRMQTTLRVGGAYPYCDSGAGAFLAASAWGGLEVAPLEQPWWRLVHGAEVEAGVELTVFGLDVFEHSGPIAALPGDGGAEAADDTGSAEPRSSGEDQRWAVAIDDIDVPSGFESTSVGRLSDGTAIVVSRESVTGRNRMVALDRFGAFQWSVKYQDGYQPSQVKILDGDTILVGGTPSWLAAHDATGNLLWSGEFEVGESDDIFARCTLKDFVAVPDGDGQHDVVVIGQLGRSNIRMKDGCAFRVEWGGASLAWARTLVDDGVQDLAGAVLTRDGDIAVVGRTETGPDVFSLDNPLVLKLDADGHLQWAKSLPMIQRGGRFGAVAEAEDGTLFMVGEAPRSTHTGAALVARIASDGDDPLVAFHFQDEEWELELEAEQGDAYTDTAAGHTSWDRFLDIAPVTGGFVVVGHTGLPDNPYEDDGHAAWALKINGRLGTEWFTVFDGVDAEQFDGIAVDDEGMLVSGWSDSFDALGDERHLWVSRFGFSGRFDDLDPYAVTSRYIETGTRDGSNDPDVTPVGVPSMDAPLVVEDATLADALEIASLLDTPSRLCVTRLTESGHDSTADDCGP